MCQNGRVSKKSGTSNSIATGCEHWIGRHVMSFRIFTPWLTACLEACTSGQQPELAMEVVHATCWPWAMVLHGFCVTERHEWRVVDLEDPWNILKPRIVVPALKKTNLG